MSLSLTQTLGVASTGGAATLMGRKTLTGLGAMGVDGGAIRFRRTGRQSCAASGADATGSGRGEDGAR